MRFAMILALVISPGPILAQGIDRTVDDFTGQAIVSTKYSRLDDRTGCGRVDIAIVLRQTGRDSAAVESLHYMWGKEEWLGAVAAFLNIDGSIVELTPMLIPPKMTIEGRLKIEVGGFTLPRGTLARIGATSGVKLRIIGTNRTCDGTLEPNVYPRVRSLLAAVGQ